MEKESEKYSPPAVPPPVVSKMSQSSKDVEGYVGFASLPNQVYRKSVKRGFEFTLMVVGKLPSSSLLLITDHFIGWYDVIMVIVGGGVYLTMMSTCYN